MSRPSLDNVRLRLRSSAQAVRATTLFVLFVALLTVNGWLALRGRDEALREATMANTNLTRAIAQQMDSSLLESGRNLDAVAFELERVNDDTTTLERLQPVLANYAAATEQIHSPL